MKTIALALPISSSSEKWPRSSEQLSRGQFRGVSEAKLLELVTRLGHDVKIVVGPVRRRTGKIELKFA